jgi:hypothetical protein
MRRRRHFHACADCKIRMACSASIIDNRDGWPEWLCTAEADSAPGEKFRCEDCHEEHLRREEAEEAAERAAEEAEEAASA